MTVDSKKRKTKNEKRKIQNENLEKKKGSSLLPPKQEITPALRLRLEVRKSFIITEIFQDRDPPTSIESASHACLAAVCLNIQDVDTLFFMQVSLQIAAPTRNAFRVKSGRLHGETRSR